MFSVNCSLLSALCYAIYGVVVHLTTLGFFGVRHQARLINHYKRQKTKGMGMILGIGIDMADMGRFLDWSPFKKARIFTKKELDYAAATVAGGEKHLANFWAAREAFVKALGTGFGDDIQFSDISVAHDDNGRPTVLLAGGAKAALKAMAEDAKVHLSITDQGDYSAAVVIIEK